jgi:hypothetical protein
MMNGIMGRLSNRKWRELLGGFLFRKFTFHSDGREEGEAIDRDATNATKE